MHSLQLTVVSLSILLIYHSYSLIPTEFDHVKTERINADNAVEIGWFKIMSCTESTSSSIFTYSHTNDEIKNFARSAISIKITPNADSDFNDGYTVIAKPNSNPVLALNRYKTISYKIDHDTNFFAYSDTADWIGLESSKARLANNCYYGTLDDFDNNIYHACGNPHGLHILPAQNVCLWEYNDLVHKNIEIYLGFYTGPSLSGFAICNNINFLCPYHNLIPIDPCHDPDVQIALGCEAEYPSSCGDVLNYMIGNQNLNDACSIPTGAIFFLDGGDTIDGVPLVKYTFHSACVMHDVCYKSPGVSKGTCDYQFKMNMYSIATITYDRVWWTITAGTMHTFLN
eukprot:366141_1